MIFQIWVAGGITSLKNDVSGWRARMSRSVTLGVKADAAPSFPHDSHSCLCPARPKGQIPRNYDRRWDATCGIVIAGKF